MTDADDGRRGEKALIITLVDHDDGKRRLIFDDAQSNGLGKWEVKAFFTHSDYNGKKFELTNFTKEELADIGLNVVARLAVLNGMVR